MLSRLRFILRHAVEYRTLMRWLFGQAFASFGRRIVQSALLSVASVAVELVSFGLVVRLLRVLEVEGSEGLAVLIGRYGLPAWSVPFALLAPSLVFIAAGYLHYLSRTVAIGLQSGVSTRLSDNMILRLGRTISPLEGDSLPYGLDRRELLRVISTDTMFCGIAVRQTLVQAISVPYLIVGLVIVAVLAPVLLLLWIVALGLVLPVLYVLNLKALSDARELGDVAPQYRRSLIGRVQTLLGSPQPALDQADLSARYTSAFDGRLRVSEGSRLALAVVFAAAIAVFFLSALHPKLQPSFNSSSLLVLFLALRYTYQGLQGMSVLVSVINRFLPALMRVHGFDRKLGQLEARSERLEQLRNNHQGSLEFRYRVPGGAGASSESSGTFVAGKTYLVLSMQMPKLGSAGQLMDVLNPAGSRLAFIANCDRSPELLSGGSVTASHGEKVPLWAEDLIAQTIAADPDSLGGNREFIERIAVRAAGAPGIIFLDGNLLTELPRAVLQQILDRLSRHLVFVLSNRVGLVDEHPFDGLLISDGKSIVKIVLAGEALTRDERLELRRLLAARRTRPEVDDTPGASAVFQDDDDMIG